MNVAQFRLFACFELFSYAWVGMINDGYQDTNKNSSFYWINDASGSMNDAVKNTLGLKVGGAAQWTTWATINSAGSDVKTVSSITNYLRYKGNMNIACRSSKFK